MTGITADMTIEMLHPGLLMACLGVLVLLLPKFCRIPLGVLAPVAALWAAMQITADSSLKYAAAPHIQMELIHSDSLAYAFLLVFCVISVLTAIFGAGVQDKYECGMSLIYAGCAMGTVLAGDCISMILFWEMTVAASVYMVWSGRRRASMAASMRYFIVQAAASCLLLAGLITYIFHYGNSLENISACYGEPCFWLTVAAAALFTAVPPLHAWLPDAYPESSVTGILSLSLIGLGTAAYLILRLAGGYEFMIWAGLIASLYAAVMSLMENDIRRLLSYQVVSQLGIIISAAGAGGEAGIDAAFFHAAASLLSLTVLMMCAGMIIYTTGKRKVTDLGGMFRRMPAAAVCFLICSFSLSGMPGLAGFTGWRMVMNVIGGTGSRVQAVLIIACAAGTLLAVTLRAGWYIFFGHHEGDESENVGKTPLTMTITAILGSIAVIAMGIFPEKIAAYLPYASEAASSGAGDVISYIAMFLGCALPFFLLIRRLEPRDEVILDFDWFLRKIVK